MISSLAQPVKTFPGREAWDMRHEVLHAWDVSIVDAAALQERWREKIRIGPFKGEANLIAGARRVICRMAA